MRKPAEWTEATVAEEFTLGRGRVISHQEIRENPGNYPVYSSQSFNKGEMGRIATYDFEGESLTWTTDGAYAGTIFYRNGRYNCTNVCGIAKPKGEASGIDLRYSAYFLSTVAKKFVSYHGNPKLMNNIFGEIPIVLPPLPEQKKIAEILSSVDELIEKTERLIARLKELKKAMLQELLTKGIGHTKFKDSPVGRIPEDWEVVRLGKVCSLQSGYAFKSENFVLHGIPVLRIGNIIDGAIDLNDTVFHAPVAGIQDAFVAQKGDLLIAMSGATTGKIGRYFGSKPVYVNQRVGKFQVQSVRMSTGFIECLLSDQSHISRMLIDSIGGAQPNISGSQIETLTIALPPLGEQRQIENSVSAVTRSIENHDRKRKSLAFLKQALMQDLLTGKVRVKV